EESPALLDLLCQLLVIKTYLPNLFFPDGFGLIGLGHSKSEVGDVPLGHEFLLPDPQLQGFFKIVRRGPADSGFLAEIFDSLPGLFHIQAALSDPLSGLLYCEGEEGLGFTNLKVSKLVLLLEILDLLLYPLRLLRSEEHTSELQSRENLVCRLLLEKK